MRYLFYLITSIISAIILWINLALYHATDREDAHKDILNQLIYLEEEIKEHGMAEEMQSLFPEGYVFTYALYGLNWCEMALSDPSDELGIREKAIEEALFAYDRINSDQARSTFTKNISPQYGIFYQGWKNYLLSRVFTINRIFPGAVKYLAEYRNNCDQIALATEKNTTPFLSSYPGGAWPADMFPALASLANWDKCFQTSYDTTIQKWLNQLPEFEDTNTGLLPFRVNAADAYPVQGPRASSTGVICKFLMEIDPSQAHRYFRLYREQFEHSRLGLPALLEFPKGTNGDSDIDSGPVIWGVGFSATVSAIACYGTFGETAMANALFQTVHGFGFCTSFDNKSRYLFGAMPIADLFIVWGRACSLNHPATLNASQDNFRLKFHSISIAFMLLFWIPAFRIFRSARKKN